MTNMRASSNNALHHKLIGFYEIDINSLFRIAYIYKCGIPTILLVLSCFSLWLLQKSLIGVEPGKMLTFVGVF